MSSKFKRRDELRSKYQLQSRMQQFPRWTNLF